MSFAEHSPTPALQAGLLYFIGVFALGFLLGVVRLTLLVPWLGELGAVIVEVPIVLGFSWVLCRRAVSRFAVPAVWGQRVLMGATAFLLLMLAELALALWLFGDTLATFGEKFTTAPGAVGFAGQVLFALFPLLQRGSNTPSVS